MVSFKELSLSRPFPHPNHNRHHHSHSISLGAVNPNHRVTRRKSVTTTAASATNAAAAAAVAAASIKDSSGEPSGIPMPAASARRGSSRKPFLESSSVGASSGFPSSSSYLSRSMNNPSTTTTTQDPVAANLSSAPNAHKPEQQPSAPNGSASTTNGSSSPAPAPKNRNRRASEGSHLVKGEGKRALAEIRCDRCGKGYKHGSCLSKHMWEHDPAWAITSKLLISKHQQVQLLEAASVLVNMNHDGPEAESELSSASPDASSERHEGLSSADTTPPPMEQMNSVDEEEDDMEEEENDEEDDMEMSDTGDKLFTVPNNNSNNPSGLYSRSYQTGPSSSFTGSAPLHSPSFSNYQRHSSIDTRPSTADTKLHDDVRRI